MKISTKHLHPEDIKVIQRVVSILRVNNPTITVKSYITHAILQYTQTLMEQMAAQQKAALAEQQAKRDTHASNSAQSEQNTAVLVAP